MNKEVIETGESDNSGSSSSLWGIVAIFAAVAFAGYVAWRVFGRPEVVAGNITLPSFTSFKEWVPR